MVRGIRRHDLADLAAMRMNEIGGDPVGSDQETSASGRALRSVPISARRMKSPSRNDADQSARCVDHGQPADMVPQHRFGGLDDARIGADRNDVLGHDLMRAHRGVSGSGVFRAFSSEVKTGSRQENASNQELKGPLRCHRSEEGASHPGRLVEEGTVVLIRVKPANPEEQACAAPGAGRAFSADVRVCGIGASRQLAVTRCAATPAPTRPMPSPDVGTTAGSSASELQPQARQTREPAEALSAFRGSYRHPLHKAAVRKTA